MSNANDQNIITRLTSAVKQGVFERLHSRPEAYARTRRILSRHPLPPGDFAELDILEKTDRDLLRKRSEGLGPVFKGLAWNKVCVYVVGLELCRKITKTHGHQMSVNTLELEHLIPNGFLSAMTGEMHRHYRAATLAALKNFIGESDESRKTTESVLDTIVTDGLRRYAERTDEHGDSPEAFTTAASGIATSMITWLFFGAAPGTAIHDQILAHFHELGPYGLVWNPKQRQETAFRDFRDHVLAEVAALRAGTSTLTERGMLGQMVKKNTLDETLVGNLIYQAEMGRFDIKNFFRWLMRHVSDDPNVLEEIADEECSRDTTRDTTAERSRSEAFVLETLRTDQSENLLRHVQEDFIFEGFLIPKGAMVRMCLWESHHDEEKFINPHGFERERFLHESPGRDRFAPFGLDKHQCPFGNPVIRMGTVFVRALARDFHVVQLAEGPPVRGPYHWEPAPKFSVHLSHRSDSEEAIREQPSVI